MRSFLAVTLLASLLGSPARALATRQAAAAWKYRAVHVDTVDPAKLSQFEGARREWLETLKAKHLTDGRGYFLQVDGSSFLTLCPFASFAELDRRGATGSKVTEFVGRDAQARYDARSDDALLPPHRNEIWSREAELDFTPEHAPLDELSAGAGRMVLEELRPAPSAGEAYQRAWEVIRQVLTAAKYPLTRRTFSSTYGSGKLISLWLAKNHEELTAAAPVEAVVLQGLGKAKADEVFRNLKRALVDVKTSDLRVRPDLTVE